jgi:hypothetical protein
VQSQKAIVVLVAKPEENIEIDLANPAGQSPGK